MSDPVTLPPMTHPLSDLLPRFGLAFALLALMAGLALWLVRRQRGGARSMVVHERLPVSRGVSLMLLAVEERRYLVSVSADGARLLKQLPASTEPLHVAPEATAPSPAAAPLNGAAQRFASLLGRIRTDER